MKYRFQNVRPDDEKAAYSGIVFYRKLLTVKLTKIQYGDIWTQRTKWVISEAVGELKLVNQEIREKKDIINTYDSLILYVTKLLLNEVEKYNKESFISCIYTLAAYMIEIHSYINLIGNDRFTIEKVQQKGIFHQEEELILMISDVFKSNDKDVYLNLSNGEDNAIIQHLLMIAVNCEYIGIKRITDNDLFKIFDLTAAIVYLINEREMFTSELVDDWYLSITSDGIESNTKMKEEKLHKVAYNQTEFCISTESIIDKSTLLLLEQSLFKKFGFKLSTVEKMLKNHGTSGVTAERYALVHLLPKKKLVELIQKEGICSKCEAEKIIEYFTIKSSCKKDILKTFDKLSSRIFENPILKYNNDDFYLFSNNLMLVAHDILFNKLVYNLIPECCEDNSLIIEENIKTGFEKITYTIISKYLDCVEHDVQDMEIIYNGKKRLIHLEKQVDIWALQGSTMYIFECKDICTKYTFTGFRNDIIKTKGYIKNIRDKVNEITNKKQDIQCYFKCDINTIIPVLVFRNYNAAIHSEINKNGIIIMSFLECKRLNFGR